MLCLKKINFPNFKNVCNHYLANQQKFIQQVKYIHILLVLKKIELQLKNVLLFFKIQYLKTNSVKKKNV